MSLYEFALSTAREGFHNITGQVRSAVLQSGVADGLCLVFCPHTTAGLTINENADPDVTRDLAFGLAQAFPDRAEFRHAEGNSAAHLKAGSVGSGLTLIVAGGQPLLGTWQGVYFCEFDGPRQRRFHVKIVADR